MNEGKYTAYLQYSSKTKYLTVQDPEIDFFKNRGKKVNKTNINIIN